MTSPAFTILLPVHRPPALLPYAIATVLAQDQQDFELFVICDGAPPETAAVARDYAAKDSRIRVFEHPKGERMGEVYRDQALQEARGRYVCQIADDDLWLPNHLAEISKLLSEFDFGNISAVSVRPEGEVRLEVRLLQDERNRAMMLREQWTPFGPTPSGYRLEAYRRLPVGWSPAPSGFPSDLFMWRKFLAFDGIRVGTRIAVTTAHFDSTHHRPNWPIERRLAETREWAERLADPIFRERFVQMAFASVGSQIVAGLQSRAELKTKREFIGQRLREALEANKELHQELKRARRRIKKLRRELRLPLFWRLVNPLHLLARAVGLKSRDRSRKDSKA